MKPSLPSPQVFERLIALFNARRYVELEQQVNVVLATHPHAAFAWQLLGGALQMQGKDALAAFRKVTELTPNDAAAHFNLGVACKSGGLLEQAAASYRRALQLNSAYAEALGNLGSVLHDLGQLDEAAECYHRALQLQPAAFVTHNGLGSVLKDQGQFERALSCYRRATQLRPDYAEAYFNAGNVLRELGRLEEAVSAYQQAVQRQPGLAQAWVNLGAALQKLERMQEALAALQRAVQIAPDMAEAHRNLGALYQSLGQTQQAQTVLQRASALQPDHLAFAMQAALLLPIIPQSTANIAQWRNHYQQGLETLHHSARNLQAPVEQLSNESFYLAYHNQSNRPLMENLHQLYRGRVAALSYTAPHLAKETWYNPARRIRVGFLSEFLFEHTIGKHYQGFIHHLDRSRFEVIVVHSPKSRHDEFRSRLDQSADGTLTLPSKLEEQQRAVADLQLDVLFYPDIGMSSATYFLAYSRLAPVQLTSWGHPDTTGLDSMDYYLSAYCNEPVHAQQNFSERLVRLNRLPCFYYRTAADTIPSLSKAELGLPETGMLYGCPQNLFKLHPDFDAVLAAIAELDPTGHLVIPAGKHPEWTELIRARWADTFPILCQRVVFTPRMNWPRFMATLSHMDVLLDPLYFGSGNTFYDAMIFGMPVITCPGNFGRGRNVAAAYRQMGVADAPIVERIADYAPLAVLLAQDVARRKQLQQASLQAASAYLFEDMQAVRELESFLSDAVAAAATRSVLPENWTPHALT